MPEDRYELLRRFLAKFRREPQAELTEELYDHVANIRAPLTARLKPKGFFQDDWRARPTTARP